MPGKQAPFAKQGATNEDVAQDLVNGGQIPTIFDSRRRILPS